MVLYFWLWVQESFLVVLRGQHGMPGSNHVDQLEDKHCAISLASKCVPAPPKRWYTPCNTQDLLWSDLQLLVTTGGINGLNVPGVQLKKVTYKVCLISCTISLNPQTLKIFEKDKNHIQFPLWRKLLLRFTISFFCWIPESLYRARKSNLTEHFHWPESPLRRALCKIVS